jgi:hypothetical protein
MLEELELGLGVIACPQQLASGLVVGPVLEAEAVGAASPGPEERDQLVDLRLLLEATRDIPAAARLAPVDVALLVPRAGRHHRGRELRPARRPIGDVVRKPDLVETAHGHRLSPPNRSQRIPLLPVGPLWHSSARVEQSKNTPPRYAIRLDDLRAWHVIFATCAACGKRTHIDARLLQHGRPPYTRLLDLERKLRCSSCGNRQGNTLSVSMAPQN